MTIIIEHFESQEVTRNYDESAVEIRAKILGEENTVIAEYDFYDWLQTLDVVSGMFLRQTNVKHLGGGVHEATATFFETNYEITKTIRYRTTGQSARVIQSYDTVYADALVGNPPDFGGLIGFNGTSVEGVDIPIPGFSFSVDYRFSAVTQEYLYLCHQLTGTVNNADCLGFAAGELLFMGIEGEVGLTAGGAVVMSSSPISFAFEAMPNVTGLQVGAFSVPLKYGWDYLWPRTREDVSENRIIRVTDSIHIERVLRWADHSLLGIG